MKEDIEELLKRKDDYDFAYGTQIYKPYTMSEKDWELIENLLTRYKQLDSLIGEIDNKEASDALHTLLHCALTNKDFETQKQQFQIVNAYIKQLEEENKRLNSHNIIGRIDAIKIEDLEPVLKPYYIPKSKVKEKIEELDNKRRKFTSDNVNNFYLQEFTRKYTQKSDHDYGVFSTPETITYCTNNELLGRVEVLQELLREE